MKLIRLFNFLGLTTILLIAPPIYADQKQEDRTKKINFWGKDSTLKRNKNYKQDEIIVGFQTQGSNKITTQQRSNLLNQTRSSNTQDSLSKLNLKYNVKASRAIQDKRILKGIKGFRRHARMKIRKQLKLLRKSSKKQFKRIKKKYKKSLVKILYKKRIRLLKPHRDKLKQLAETYSLKIDGNVEEAIKDFSSLPSVKFAQANYYVKAYDYRPNDPFFNLFNSWGQRDYDLWGLEHIKAPKAWDSSKGKGIVVAVIDSGLDITHPDIADNVWVNNSEYPSNGVDDDKNGFIDDYYGWNFHDNNANISDIDSHGTHVAGTIAAIADNHEGIVGVAPQAQIMAVKGLGEDGGTFLGLSQAIIYAATNGADVINNSWGCSLPCPYNPFSDNAVEIANALDSVVVFAAGNSADDVQKYSPQNHPLTITVGATTIEDLVADFYSSFGTALDVVAPGGGAFKPYPEQISPHHNILSLKSTSALGFTGGSTVHTNYLRQLGTSMAAPHVSGLAALIRTRYPSYTAEKVRQAIKTSSDDIGVSGFDYRAGNGRINAAEALKVLNPLEVIVLSPTSTPIRTNEVLDVIATVKGPNLLNWTLDFSEKTSGPHATFESSIVGWQTLATGTKSVSKGNIANIDTNKLNDGAYIFRIRATDRSGRTFEDLQEITIDRFEITSPDPSEWKYFSSESPMNIYGTINTPGLINYAIILERLYGDEYRLVSDAKITLNGEGKKPVISDLTTGDGLIASIDPASLKEGHYKIKVIAKSAAGSPVGELNEFDIENIIFDPYLHPWWPLRLTNPDSVSWSNEHPKRHLTLADVDKNGSDEILVGFNSKIDIIDIYGLSLPGWPQSVVAKEILLDAYGSPAVGDLDGDGQYEIVASGSNVWEKQSYIFAWTFDGNLKNGFPVARKTTKILLSLADVDHDGDDEIVFTDTSGNIEIIDESTKTLSGWPVSFGDGDKPGLFPPQVADLDQDGNKEVIVFEQQSPASLAVYDAKGKMKTGWPILINKEDVADIVYNETLPVLSDIDNDNDLEIAIGSTDGTMFVFHHNGQNLNAWPQGPVGEPFSTAAVGDVEADGLIDIFAGTGYRHAFFKQFQYFAWDRESNMKKGFPVSLPGTFRSNYFGFGSTALADINGNGLLEAIVAGNRNDLKASVLNAFQPDGRQLPGFPRPTRTGGIAGGDSVALGDVDGDSLLEMVWIDRSGTIYVWNLKADKYASRPRPMYLGNARLNGDPNSQLGCLKKPDLKVLAPIPVQVGKTISVDVINQAKTKVPRARIKALHLPKGASFTNNTFKWKPSTSDIGTNKISFQATNDCGQTDIGVLEVVVLGGNTTPAEITSIASGVKNLAKVIATLKSHSNVELQSTTNLQQWRKVSSIPTNQVSNFRVLAQKSVGLNKWETLIERSPLGTEYFRLYAHNTNNSNGPMQLTTAYQNYRVVALTIDLKNNKSAVLSMSTDLVNYTPVLSLPTGTSYANNTRARSLGNNKWEVKVSLPEQQRNVYWKIK